MSKHTPGPWTLGTRLSVISAAPATERTIEAPLKEDGAPVCLVRGDFGAVEANARLIAAAPEMLEALKAGLRFCNLLSTEDHKLALVELQVWSVRAAAAIAKAEGK